MSLLIKKQMKQYSAFLKAADVKNQLENAIDSAFPSGKVTTVTPTGRAKTTDKPLDRVTSPYGKRVHPVTGKSSFHSGIDLAAPIGAEIKSWESGVVVKTGSDNISGNYVIIKHSDGFKTSYSHLSKVLVNTGQSVNKNQVIGLAGKSGRVTGPHLHFRMSYKNQHIDPAEYLAGRSLVGPVRGDA